MFIQTNKLKSELKIMNKIPTIYFFVKRVSNISLYTMFLVVLVTFPSSSSISIFSLLLVFTLEITTYSCPCLNKGRGR